nr:hypothetical protein [Bacteroidota bacterium]
MELLKKIFSVFMALWMIVITGGVNIYAHYCGTCNGHEISLTGIEAFCEANHYTAELCDVDSDHQDSDCCAGKPQECNDSSTKLLRSNCCSFEQRYFKLDTSFDNQIKINIKYIHTCIELNWIIESIGHIQDEVQQIVAISNHSPPNFVGKEMVIFLHTLKIPVS